MHRQGKTELFDACPLCLERGEKYNRVDVRDDVWFTCCPECFSGLRVFFLHKRTGTSRHPALGKGRRQEG